jgi:hypothetical protein
MSDSPISYLFPEHTRQTDPFAPTLDPSRHVKTWVDPTAAGLPFDQLISYSFVDMSSGKPSVGTITMPASEAWSLNLPGIQQPTPWKAPTANVGVLMNGMFTAVLSPELVSTKAQANQLAVDLGLNLDAVEIETLDHVTYAPDGEYNRYALRLPNGTLLNVGQALKSRSAAGVNSAGHWDLSTYTWVSEVPPTPPTPTLPAWPRPIVPLAKGQTLVAPQGMAGMFGGQPMIHTPDAPAPTQQDRIEALLNRIAAKVGA